jgi:hypothetical protein
MPDDLAPALVADPQAEEKFNRSRRRFRKMGPGCSVYADDGRLLYPVRSITEPLGWMFCEPYGRDLGGYTGRVSVVATDRLHTTAPESMAAATSATVGERARRALGGSKGATPGSSSR